MTADVIEIEKADVTVTPPGGGTLRFAILRDKPGQPLPDAGKRKVDEVHYDMYKQHPIVRAATDKKAKVATTNGFTFRAEDQSDEVDTVKAKELRRFFRLSDWPTLFFQTFQDLGIYGRSYWYVQRETVVDPVLTTVDVETGAVLPVISLGKPVKAKRLHPKFVDVEADGINVTGFRYGPMDPNNASHYEPAEVVVFRIPDPDNDVHGLSPLSSLEKTVAIDLFAMDYNGSFFENSAQTGIVFQIKGASEGEIERNRTWLEENYAGTKNAHKPLLLEGEVEVKKSVASHAEMGFIEGRNQNRMEILAVIDVDPDKLGYHADSNRSTAKESGNSFRSESVRPFQTLVEGPINNHLLLEMYGWDDILFGFNEVDTSEEMANLELISKAQSSGLLSTDEGRNRLGYGKVKNGGGDIHFVQTSAGLVPLSILEEQAKTELEKSKVSLRQSQRLAEAPLPSQAPGVGQPGVRPPTEPTARQAGVTTKKD